MAVAYSGYAGQLNTYRANSVLVATPAQLVLRSYDMALAALAAEDGSRACKAIVQLIESLDFK